MTKKIRQLKSLKLKNLFIYNCDVSREKQVKKLFTLLRINRCLLMF